MRPGILLVLVIPVVFLLVIAVYAIRSSWHGGDETPGWTRVHRLLPIHRLPAEDRPVQFGSESRVRRNDVEESD